MSNAEGILRAIAVKPVRRGPMSLRESAAVTIAAGLEGDCRGTMRRQITILAVEDWAAAVAETGALDLPWTVRRANLLVAGLSFPRRAGWHIEIGAIRLEVLGETDPCERMEEQQCGLRAALTPAWRGGVYCRVVEGGEIAVGQTVRILDANP